MMYKLFLLTSVAFAAKAMESARTADEELQAKRILAEKPLSYWINALPSEVGTGQISPEVFAILRQRSARAEVLLESGIPCSNGAIAIGGLALLILGWLAAYSTF